MVDKDLQDLVATSAGLIAIGRAMIDTGRYLRKLANKKRFRCSSKPSKRKNKRKRK